MESTNTLPLDSLKSESKRTNQNDNLESTLNTLNGQKHDRKESNLENFAKYCKIFYQHSLSILTDDSPQINNEVKTAQVVLEALEHQLYLSTTDPTTLQYQTFLASEKVRKELPALESCGLYNSKLNGEIIPRESKELFEYVKRRDQARRSAHETQMMQRIKYLYNEIVRQECVLVSEETMQENVDCPATSSHTSTPLPSKPRVTRRQQIRNIKMNLRNFVSKYKSNIGTHSFLAGMRKILESQLSLENDLLVCWSFQAVILSESYFSDVDGTKKSGDIYIKDAVQVLLSLFVRFSVDRQEIDIEICETKENSGLSHDLTLNFHVDSAMSNSSLKLILEELPSKSLLDARATGKTYVMSSDSFIGTNVSIKRRINVKGELDESGPATFLHDLANPFGWNYSNCIIL